MLGSESIAERYPRSLRIGTWLFLIGGVVDSFIGGATPFVTRLFGIDPVGAFIISARTDSELLGISPNQLVLTGSPAATLYGVMIDLVGLLILAFGLLQVGIAWFGLRRGTKWALGMLVVADVVFITGWMVVLSHYLSRGIYPALIELPPNFLVPALLLVPASLFSFDGLRKLG